MHISVQELACILRKMLYSPLNGNPNLSSDISDWSHLEKKHFILDYMEVCTQDCRDEIYLECELSKKRDLCAFDPSFLPEVRIEVYKYIESGVRELVQEIIENTRSENERDEKENQGWSWVSYYKYDSPG